MKQIKPIKAWAGIAEEKFDYGWDEEEGFQDGHYGIYKTRKEARNHYQLVIPILITPIKTERK